MSFATELQKLADQLEHFVFWQGHFLQFFPWRKRSHHFCIFHKTPAQEGYFARDNPELFLQFKHQLTNPSFILLVLKEKCPSAAIEHVFRVILQGPIKFYKLQQNLDCSLTVPLISFIRQEFLAILQQFIDVLFVEVLNQGSYILQINRTDVEGNVWEEFLQVVCQIPVV